MMYKFSKRVLDIILALITLIALLPLFIVVSVILRFTGEGDSFYFQERIGENNKYFDIWKFATMLRDSPNIGTGMITLQSDPRVTKFGSFLRKSKINELPQIINVLKGDMSIVGPRPTVKKHYESYPLKTREEIYTNKPGITGIASIVFRDEESLLSLQTGDPFEYYKDVIMPFKAKLEKWYINNRGMITDLLLIFITAWVILFSSSQLHYKIFKDLPKRPF